MQTLLITCKSLHHSTIGFHQVSARLEVWAYSTPPKGVLQYLPN